MTLLGRLADPELESAFQRDHFPATRKRLRFVCALTAPAYLAATYADSLQLSGAPLTNLATARTATALFGLLALALSMSKRVSPARLGVAAGMYMAALMATECYEAVLKAGAVPLPQAPITVFMALLFYLFQPPQLWQSLLAGGAGSAAYLATLALAAHAPADYLANTTLLFALANGFGLYYAIRFGAAQRKAHLALCELRHQAGTDALTGVLNRRRLLSLAEREFSAAKRYGHPCSLVMIDIDHFKDINDTYGHAAGDQVLVELAARCRSKLREVDLFGRVGGEEFVVVMPHSNREQAAMAAERLLDAVRSRPFDGDGRPIKVTVSIGVAGLDTKATYLDILLKYADAALYQAKQQGRDRVYQTPPSADAARAES